MIGQGASVKTDLACFVVLGRVYSILNASGIMCLVKPMMSSHAGQDTYVLNLATPMTRESMLDKIITISI